MEKIKQPRGRKALIAFIVWVIGYIGGILVLRHLATGKWLGLGISVASFVSFAIFVYQYIETIASMDEVKQRIQFEAVAIGFACSILLTMFFFLLDLANMLDYGFASYGHLVLYFILFYYIGYIQSKRKYTR